jgi:hypothetical protein
VLVVSAHDTIVQWTLATSSYLIGAFGAGRRGANMMTTLKHAGWSIAAVAAAAMMGQAGSGTESRHVPTSCGSAGVIPLTAAEPAPRLVVEPPLAGPLAERGVAVIPYCAEHMRLAPVFGPGALSVSPRIGHVHVTVDDASWHWADASGTPVILRGLAPGAHRVLIELVDANHKVVDKGTVTFSVP